MTANYEEKLSNMGISFLMADSNLQHNHDNVANNKTNIASQHT